jgi:hypothetical protein
LAVSDSTVDCPEQSGPCPGHTFQKTAAINAIIAKVLDNAFCHLLTFRLRKSVPNSKKISGIWRGRKPNGVVSPTRKTHVGPDESGARQSQFLCPLAYGLKSGCSGSRRRRTGTSAQISGLSTVPIGNTRKILHTHPARELWRSIMKADGPVVVSVFDRILNAP